MLVDTGCSRTLVHRKFASLPDNTNYEDCECITVLTATGERVIVPLRWVEIEVALGRYKEPVRIVDNLPVDCLLGRSSYGTIVTRDDLLDHWGADEKAMVMTRSQTKQRAQERLNELVDRENDMSKKTLTQPIDKRAQSEPGKHAETPKTDECATEFSTDQVSSEVNIIDRSANQVIADQQNDVTLAHCRKVALHVPPSENEAYYYDKGILMHRKFTRDMHDGVMHVDRIVVPESYRSEILRISHAIPLAGHLGRDKTKSRIDAHFFWPKLSFDVSKFCATCHECQLVTRKMTLFRAPLQPVPIVTEPFKKIAIDIVGELPRTKTGYRYILTIVDYATRYPEAFPLRSITS